MLEHYLILKILNQNHTQRHLRQYLKEVYNNIFLYIYNKIINFKKILWPITHHPIAQETGDHF